MLKKTFYILLTIACVAGSSVTSVLATAPNLNQRPGLGGNIADGALYNPNCAPTEVSNVSSVSAGGLAGEEGTEGTFSTTPGENKRMQILVHTTEGDSAAGAISALKANGTGYHVLIEEDGKEIRLIKDAEIAHGARSANSKSLHVSLVGFAKDGTHFDPNSPQLQTLSKRISHWAEKYDIPVEKIEGAGMLDGGNAKGVGGHIDIAKADPAGYASNGRSDPGENFPWSEVLKNAGGKANIQKASSQSAQNDPCCSAAQPASMVGSGVNGGDCGDKGYGTGQSPDANKAQIWSFLTGNGLSPEAAAGIMGNIEQESGFMPDADNKISGYGGPVGVGCVGIVQWCFERIDNLANFAKERNKPWDCLGLQLEFMWHEMSETSEGRMYQGETLSITLQDALNGADMPNRSRYYPDGKPTPAGAARMFHNYFERANEAAGEHLGRDGRAETIFAEFSGTSGTAIKASAACATKTESQFGGGILQAAIEMGRWGGEYQACYTFGGGHSDKADLERRIENRFHGPENGVDCSGFVSAAILKGTGDFFVGSTQAFCESNKFDKIPLDKAEPGDLSIDCGTHVEVITSVKGPGDFETVGSRTTGCGPGLGASPGNYNGTESFVLRYTGEGTKT